MKCCSVSISLENGWTDLLFLNLCKSPNTVYNKRKIEKVVLKIKKIEN